MKRHALIVGINHYQDPALNDLRGAERDAADLHGILRDRLRFDLVEYLPAPKSDELIAMLDDMVAGLSAGDQLLFFFAGHGVLDDRQGEQLLLMPNVRFGLIEHRVNTVSVSLLRDVTAGRGLQRVFILDCCRSNLEAHTRDGTRTLFRGATVLRDLGVSPRRRTDLPPESLSILCSCDDGHQAAEIPNGRGLFTAALADRLRAEQPLIALDGGFIAGLTNDMRDIATRYQLDHDQQPLWIPDGDAPVLWRRAPDDGDDRARMRDAALWTVAKSADTAAGYRAYLDHCEACAHRAAAEAAIARLKPEPTPAPARPAVGAASAANGGGEERKPIAAEAAPTKSEPVALPRIELIHGWHEGGVKGLQEWTAKALGKPVVYRDRLKDGSEGPELVVIPAGRFLMGSPKDEPERGGNEGPQHEIEIGKAFGLGRYAVTFGEFDRYCEVTRRHVQRGGVLGLKRLGYGPPDEGWGRGRRPVINVSWDDAVGYAKWLAEETGKNYRLPTEAEWEYACRAGTEGAFNFGGISVAKANYDGRSSYEGSPKGEYREGTVAVDEFEGNRWGLYQMHGNVWEWTCSEWDEEGYKQGQNGAHTKCAEPGQSAGRALRGGSWSLKPRWLRSAFRNFRTAVYRNSVVGFRLAQDL